MYGINSKSNKKYSLLANSTVYYVLLKCSALLCQKLIGMIHHIYDDGYDGKADGI